MPIRAIISPKFTYKQQVYQLFVSTNYSSNRANGMFDTNFSSDLPSVVMPAFQFPQMGNTHYDRKGNRITLTSLRVKLHFLLREEFLRRWNIFDDEKSYSDMFTNGESLPLNPLQWFKMRLFLLRIDDDLVINEQKIINWFCSTFTFYRAPTSAEVVKGPNESGACTPGPISVHSNVLRLTTPWTGKFNILADRKFTVRVTKPSFDIDMTIPLKKEFVFSEDDDTLLYPKYYLVLMGPLSYEVDTDIVNKAFITANRSVQIATVYSWTKLNFVDL